MISRNWMYWNLLDSSQQHSPSVFMYFHWVQIEVNADWIMIELPFNPLWVLIQISSGSASNWASRGFNKRWGWIYTAFPLGFDVIYLAEATGDPPQNPFRINGILIKNITEPIGNPSAFNMKSMQSPSNINGEPDQKHSEINEGHYLTNAIGNPCKILFEINRESGPKHFKINPLRIISKRHENPSRTHCECNQNPLRMLSEYIRKASKIRWECDQNPLRMQC